MIGTIFRAASAGVQTAGSLLIDVAGARPHVKLLRVLHRESKIAVLQYAADQIGALAKSLDAVPDKPVVDRAAVGHAVREGGGGVNVGKFFLRRLTTRTALVQALNAVGNVLADRAEELRPMSGEQQLHDEFTGTRAAHQNHWGVFGPQDERGGIFSDT